ncbi:MAG: hypothetical protein OER86_08880, partial [Phycisphaerae bacterium]|nr:hypothetical protein [Phycisphaerae bacterium]
MKKPPRTADRLRRERGIVLVLTLMGLLLLAGLVMWVMNLGQQVNNRIVAQGAADTAVQGGAGWIARQMNTVAGNNVDMARYVAVINVLDSFPQAAEYAYKETTTLGEALTNQMSNGGVQGAPARLSAVANDYFEQLMAGIEDDINDLEPVVDLFEQFDVSEVTFYSQDGHLWRALVAMDETNQAVMENLGRMAQVSAVAGGEENLRDQQDSGVFLLPLEAAVPHIRGTFNDLERPVRYGLPPFQTDAETLDGDQDDDDDPPGGSTTIGVVISGGTNEPQDEWINNRGPWDVIFGWRDYVSEVTNPGTYVPGTRRTAGGGRPSNPLSRREGDNGGRTVGRETEIVAYRTYGPQSYLLRRINEYAHNNLTNTRLTMWLNALAHNKLNFVWPRSKQKRIWEPDWVIDYEEATAIAEAGDPKIRETAFFVAEIKSKYPIGDGNFLREGSYTLAFDEGQINPRIQIVRGWQDPERWGVTRLNDYVWRDDWETTVYWDAAIGIEPEY